MILSATTAVVMTITMFTPNGTELKMEWQKVERVTLEECLDTNRIYGQGGKARVVTVQCKVQE
jgi:hypothetical protein